MTETKVDTVPQSGGVILTPHKKRAERAREWCFTAYKKPPTEWKDIQYIIYQKESCPKTDKIHWQGYIELKNPITLLSVKKLFNDNTIHVEARKGTRDQARDYCRKTGGSELFEWGDWRENSQGTRNDLKSLYDIVKSGGTDGDIAERMPGHFIRYGRGIQRLRQTLAKKRKWKTEVTVIWGPSGAGKSHLADEMLPNAYWKDGTDWWEEYSQEEDVIIDEFELTQFNRKTILQLCDKFPLRLPVKGSSIQFAARRMIITTNQNPKDWFETIPELERRIDKIVELARRKD